MTLDEYLDSARDRLHVRSERQLAKLIGVNATSVLLYRRGRTWPDDATMLRIADLAGVNQVSALMDLNTWRAKSPEVKSLYEKAASALKSVALTCLVLLLCLGVAKEPLANIGNSPIIKLYIMRQRRRGHRWALTIDRLRRFIFPGSKKNPGEPHACTTILQTS